MHSLMRLLNWMCPPFIFLNGNNYVPPGDDRVITSRGNYVVTSRNNFVIAVA
jgi:hypothetical protein